MSQTDDQVAASEEAAPNREPLPLLEPADGVPPLSVYTREIAAAADLLASGTGPFAVDAERASGFRYSNRAYLIQIRRAGAGTVLIDPVSHGGDPLTVLAPVARYWPPTVDPARRGPGSAVSGRGRHAPAQPLRH